MVKKTKPKKDCRYGCKEKPKKRKTKTKTVLKKVPTQYITTSPFPNNVVFQNGTISPPILYNKEIIEPINIIKEPKIKIVKEPKIKIVKEPKIKIVKEPKIKEPKIKEPKIKEPKIKEPKVKIVQETTTEMNTNDDFKIIPKIPIRKTKNKIVEENDQKFKLKKYNNLFFQPNTAIDISDGIGKEFALGKRYNDNEQMLISKKLKSDESPINSILKRKFVPDDDTKSIVKIKVPKKKIKKDNESEITDIIDFIPIPLTRVVSDISTITEPMLVNKKVAQIEKKIEADRQREIKARFREEIKANRELAKMRKKLKEIEET